VRNLRISKPVKGAQSARLEAANAMNTPQAGDKNPGDAKSIDSQDAAGSVGQPLNRAVPLPTGTVTFLFTDVVGNVPIWERDPVAMKAALARHHAILYAAAQDYQGVVFKILGDEFQVAFEFPENALEAALQAQRALRDESWGSTGPLTVRMGLHTGPVEIIEGVLYTPDYAVSHTINRVARIRSSAHGGQILLSSATAELLHGYRPETIHLRDLGQVYLKGMSIPEQVYQVVVSDLPQAFPPLVSISHLNHNLPLQLTSFIGREKEIAAVVELLEKHRLVTLTGVGGTGKTRLALRVAGEVLPEFKHGAWLVELARLTDPALILPGVAGVFGLYEENESMPLKVRLHSYLSDKCLLLIQDNCEHLIGEVAQFVDAILHAAPGVKVLATSREGMSLAGETAYPVPSLGMPDPASLPPVEALSQYDAIKLFVERARTGLPAFTLTESNAPTVTQICRRLDGIPLAIELAAARVKVLPIEQIGARLNERFRLLTGGSRTALPRQRTLQATIDWSYGLLSEAERALLRMLSVFMGGWTLEAAEGVCGDCGSGQADVMDSLAQLVNKSLVEVETAGGEVRRYRLLETVRQYAQEKLDEAGEAVPMRDQHLDYFLDFSGEFEHRLRTMTEVDRDNHWVKRFLYEVENFRLALSWAFEAGQPEKVSKGLSLACNLLFFWEFNNLCGEGLAWIKQGLALLPAEDERYLLIRAKAYSCAGEKCNTVDSNREACLFGMESERLYRQCEDPVGHAYALCYLSDCVNYLEPDHPLAVTMSDARRFTAEIEPIFRQAGEILGLIFVLGSKIRNAIHDNDYGAAETMIAELQSINTGTPWERNEDWFFAEIARARGDLPKSLYHFQKVLDWMRTWGVNLGIPWVLTIMGEIALELEQVNQAQAYYQEAFTSAQQTGSKGLFSIATANLVKICLSKGQFQQVGFYLQTGLSLASEQDPENFICYYLLPLIEVVEKMIQPASAARLLGYIDENRIIFHGGWESHKEEYARLTAAVQARMEKDAFKAGVEAGRNLSLDQVLGEARVMARDIAGYRA
jgi:predicted ATPase/class 3 adenylate cyclase